MFPPRFQWAAMTSGDERSRELFDSYQAAIFRRTDRLFAGLLAFQWLAGIILALCITPTAWAGTSSSTHFLVWAAVLLGGVVCSLPIYLALTRPGHTSTRHVIAIGQML